MLSPSPVPSSVLKTLKELLLNGGDTGPVSLTNTTPWAYAVGGTFFFRDRRAALYHGFVSVYEVHQDF
jgi:hypothetical protein